MSIKNIIKAKFATQILSSLLEFNPSISLYGDIVTDWVIPVIFNMRINPFDFNLTSKLPKLFKNIQGANVDINPFMMLLFLNQHKYRYDTITSQRGKIIYLVRENYGKFDATFELSILDEKPTALVKDLYSYNSKGLSHPYWNPTDIPLVLQHRTSMVNNLWVSIARIQYALESGWVVDNLNIENCEIIDRDCPICTERLSDEVVRFKCTCSCVMHKDCAMDFLSHELESSNFLNCPLCRNIIIF